MEVYALFNPETQVMRSALVQGEDYDQVGDESWTEAIETFKQIFKQGEEEWVEISEEDFEKYLQGTSGGENGTGYVRDPESGEAVSAPPVEITVTPGEEPGNVIDDEPQVMTPEEYYKKQLEKLKDEFVLAMLSGNEIAVEECKEKYKKWVEESNEALKEEGK